MSDLIQRDACHKAYHSRKVLDDPDRVLERDCRTTPLLHFMAASFASLGELELHRVLGFSPAPELLAAALVSQVLRSAARADRLWAPHCAALHRDFPLAVPTPPSDPEAPASPHPACRLTLACLTKLKVAALRALAKAVDVPPRDLASCSEKGEICRLIHAKQGALAAEAQQRQAPSGVGGGGGVDGGPSGGAAASPRGFFGEREWGTAGLGAYYSGVADLRRRHVFAHELAGREWGMFFRNREEDVQDDGEQAAHAAHVPPSITHFHGCHRFTKDGQFESDDVQMQVPLHARVLRGSGGAQAPHPKRMDPDSAMVPLSPGHTSQ